MTTNRGNTSGIAALAGSIGSVALMLYAGRNNNSRLLLLLFTLWVLAPFVVLAWANIASKRWSDLTRKTLHTLTPLLTLVTLAIYAYVAFGPRRAKTAPAFVVVPVASCLVLVIVVPLAALISRRFSKR